MPEKGFMVCFIMVILRQALQHRNRLLDQAGDYAAFVFSNRSGFGTHRSAALVKKQNGYCSTHLFFTKQSVIQRDNPSSCRIKD
jgi:hypothetical protein